MHQLKLLTRWSYEFRHRIQTPSTLPQLIFVLLLFFTGYLRKSVESDRGDAEPLHWPHNRQRVQRERLHRGWQGGLWPIQLHHIAFVPAAYMAENWDPIASALETSNWQKTLNVCRVFQFTFVLLCLDFASPNLWLLSKLWSLRLNFWFITLDPSCCVCSVCWENILAVYQHINSPRFSFLSSESHWEILGWFFLAW